MRVGPSICSFLLSTQFPCAIRDRSPVSEIFQVQNSIVCSSLFADTSLPDGDRIVPQTFRVVHREMPPFFMMK